MKKVLKRKEIEREKVITEMVKLYCKKNHKNDKLCDECRDVLKLFFK